MQNQLLSLLLGQNNQAVGNLMAVAQSAGMIDIAMQGANSPTNKMGQIANLMKMLRSESPERSVWCSQDQSLWVWRLCLSSLQWREYLR